MQTPIIERELTAPLTWNCEPRSPADLLIVGGGFAGLATAMHVAAERPQTRLVIVERCARAAPGAAFGACAAPHLLNVPAGRMGALPDDPAGFLSWLSRVLPGAFGEDDFVPRALYGRYLNELFRERIEDRGAHVALVCDEVTRVRRRGDGVDVALRSGRSVSARAAVLALGLPSGRAPWTGVDAGAPPNALVEDPWASGAFDIDADADADVLVIGSGLTAIDVVIALARRGHRGRTTVISRNGRWPLPHPPPGEAPHAFAREELEGSPREVFAAVRAATAARAPWDQGWAAVIDAVRPHATSLWRAWSDRERHQFLARLRPLWEIHRHRVPQPVLAEIEALIADARLSLIRGRLVRVGPARAGRARATLERAGGEVVEMDVTTIYNCTGPVRDLRESSDPLVADLLSSGLATTDREGLGLRADEHGRLMDAAGRPDSRLVLVGALRRGELWESTAVPELREQAKIAARAITGVLSSSLPPTLEGSGASGET